MVRHRLIRSVLCWVTLCESAFMFTSEIRFKLHISIYQGVELTNKNPNKLDWIKERSNQSVEMQWYVCARFVGMKTMTTNSMIIYYFLWLITGYETHLNWSTRIDTSRTLKAHLNRSYISTVTKQLLLTLSQTTCYSKGIAKGALLTYIFTGKVAPIGFFSFRLLVTSPHMGLLPDM